MKPNRINPSSGRNAAKPMLRKYHHVSKQKNIATRAAPGKAKGWAPRVRDEHFRMFAQNANDAIITIDRDGTIMLANPAAEKMFGYASGELLGKPLTLLMPEHLHEQHRESFQRFLKTGQRNLPWTAVELVGRQKSGEDFPIEISFSELRSAGERSFTGILRDITERKQAEDTLRENEERLRVALAAVNMAVFNQDRNLRYTWIYQPQLGYTTQQVVGKTDAELLPRQVAEKVGEVKRQVIATGVGAREEVSTPWNEQTLHFDLVVEPLRNASGDVVGITGATLDITERKQAEEAERVQRALAEALRDTAAALNSTLNFDEVLDRILDNVGRVALHDASDIMFIESDVARIVRCRGFAERGLAEWVLNMRFSFRDLDSMRQMIETGQPLVIPDTQADPRWVVFPEARWIRSYLGTPIDIKGTVMGFLELHSATPGFFTGTHAAHLQAFANQAAVAMENASLLAETEHRVEQLALLYDAALALNSTLEPRAQLEFLFKIATQALHAERIAFFRYNAARNELRFELGSGQSDEVAGILRSRVFKVGRDSHPACWVAQNRVPLSMPDLSADPGLAAIDPETRSGMWVPVRHEKEILGVLGVLSTRVHAFSPHDERLLILFANQTAVAMENARLLAEAERRVRELDALNRIATSITSTLDLKRVLDLTMQEIKAVLSVEVCSLMLLDEQTHELVFEVSVGPGAEQAKQLRLGLNQGIAGWVAREGQPALVLDVRNDPRWYSQADSATGFTTRSMIAVPLKSKEKVIGVIEAINKVQGAFIPGDLQLLDSISMVVVTTIENARLFGELSNAYQELTESHAQVLDSRNTLRALFDGINDSICIINRDLQIKAINRTAAAFAGAEPQDLVGRNCHAVLCQSNGLCDDRCPIAETFHTQKPTLKTDRRVGVPTAPRELEINTYPLENAERVVDRVVYIARDVTEKRKLEASLVQSARLSAVGELAAGVAHEIGNPLTAIIGNAQMLLELVEPSDPRYRMTKLIESAGLRMEKVVRNLLNLSRQEVYRFALVDVNPSIEDVLSLVSYKLERAEIWVTKKFQADLPPITASAAHLHMVWTNLLLNAVDATGGTLSGAGEPASVTKGEKGRIQISTRTSEKGEKVQITFKDDGSGIAPEILTRIFDPFFTTKPQGKGTGLGLYISQTIIAHHHGTIQVHSQVGKGSTFVVTLPIESPGESDGVQVFAA